LRVCVAGIESGWGARIGGATARDWEGRIRRLGIRAVRARLFLRAIAFLLFFFAQRSSHAEPTRGRRVLILKVDGMNADVLFRTMQRMNPETGRSELPWMTRIFGENGTVLENFYTRGISLSAPSWSQLDTGHHTVIRGNVEYDRYTGRVYDYLNFFPFYISYARLRQVDMPGVEVLDRAGIPLLLDHFPYQGSYQSFQLYQRGVRWSTLTNVLKQRFSSKALWSLIEGSGPSLDDLWAHQTEIEIDRAIEDPAVRYLDFFVGDVDHEGHATSDPAAMLSVLKVLDATCGRLWTAIQKSPEASNTVLVMVSDHGMNNRPGVISQSFSLPDLLSSPEGGAHHVITNRHEFSDFKLKGLDPLVQRVVNPSRTSFYLKDQADHYPTAWVDLDGNERASVHLRNSDWNKLHILLLELQKPELRAPVRAAAVHAVAQTIEAHRAEWEQTTNELDQEIEALQPVITTSKAQFKKHPNKFTAEEKRTGEDKAIRRLGQRVSEWERETVEYKSYIRHMRALLDLKLDPKKPFSGKIQDLVPEMSLGDNNSVYELQNYIVGSSQQGLVLNPDGDLDEQRSFIRVNYFALFARQAVRNNPQRELSARPVDFSAMRVSLNVAAQAFWLTDGAENQLLILQNANGNLALRPIRNLRQDADGHFAWDAQEWRAGLPLHLFEDAALRIPGEDDRAAWLSAWHSEHDWFEAIAETQYSNGVIGITEQFSSVGENVPGPPGLSSVLLRYERRRRELVQPDFELFASDHWNFNVRNVNAGGNHGSFLRISTHSVWMMSGAGIPVKSVKEPHDSLDFTPCMLNLAGVADAPTSFCTH
jgi:Type I phosphodiesterase / nucleotide pyrophosphatase